MRCKNTACDASYTSSREEELPVGFKFAGPTVVFRNMNSLLEEN
jgi:hypothetical protein